MAFPSAPICSPHAYSILERFQVDCRPVNQHVFVRALADLVPVVHSVGRSEFAMPTFFEAANAISWHIFARADVDYAVVETGLGGRLDATNTIKRSDKLAILTRIGLDHTDVLGETLG
jgi:dihydrofolate synthase/folylpolyglutamate synthase